MSDKAESLRSLLEGEVDVITDILTRQVIRRGLQDALVSLSPPRPPSLPFLGNFLPTPPKVDEIPLPILLPSATDGGTPTVGLLTIREFTDKIAPKLDRDEELYALGLSDAAAEFFGEDVAQFVRGEGLISAKGARTVLNAARSGALGSNDILDNAAIKNILESVSAIVSGLGQNIEGGDIE
eukprot:6858886-Ditylum_brightwellii.AAC.1